MSPDQPPRPPKHVEPRHVFEDKSGYRHTIVIFVAMLTITVVSAFVVDFLLRVHQLPALAERDVAASASPFARPMPTPDRLSRSGQMAPADLALTFDGLPTRDDLPAILSVLHEYDVEATFFVGGDAMLQHGDRLQDLMAGGHTIGMLLSKDETSLTTLLFGPDMIDNATQFMITGETGKRTLLVRAQEGSETLGLSFEGPLARVAPGQEGYLHVVGGLAVPNVALDPEKFMSWLDDASRAEGGDALRFDLMSDHASHVIAALPLILAELSAEGYRYRAIRLPLSPDEAMPESVVAAQKRDKAIFGFLGFMQFGLTAVFLWMMVVAVLRSMIFLGLALVRGRRTAFDPKFRPPVTIIVSAYNEETVIARCVSSLLEQDYPQIEIVVVDDGSTDQTAQVVSEKFGGHPRVRLIQQENHGKWSASNYALSVVTTPFFAIADADSLFLPDTVAWLVQQFQDDHVGAVAGLVEVGNQENLLTDCQRIEYIVSQNIIRRAYETFEGILVVPGAVGAWRTQAVFNAHEFSGSSITEDADLTLAVHRAGYRVRFQEQARSVTEAPATVRDFLRQRLRWTFGMLQVAWKHRRAIGEGRTVGFISIVDSIVFGLVSSVVSPLVDLLLILMLINGIIVFATGGEATLAGFPTIVLLSYLALSIIDVINTLIAFRFERRFDLKLLLLVPFLRFGYRQLLYISTLRALWQVFTGRMAGWNKLERSGAELTGTFRASPSDISIAPEGGATVSRIKERSGTEVPNQEMQS